MIPYKYTGKKISIITVDGITQPYSVKSIKGFDYALVTINAGFNYNFKVNYGE